MGRDITIRNPNSKATTRQTYMIYSMTGVDVRDCKLAKGKASTIIDQIVNKNAYQVRDDMVKLGGVIKKRDVHKSHRSDPKAKAVKKAAPKRTSKRTTKKSAKNIPNVPDAVELATAIKLLESMGMNVSVPKSVAK